MTLYLSKCLLVFSVGLALTSCVSMTGPRPMRGEVFTEVKGPNQAVETKGKSDKQGESCAHNVLGAVAWGDASISSARVNGGIDKIQSVSYESFYVVPYYPFYAKTCTIVSGI